MKSQKNASYGVLPDRSCLDYQLRRIVLYYLALFQFILFF